MRYLRLLVIVSFISITSLQADVYNQLKSDTPCVAYQTTKGMFYVSNVDVVGINCSVILVKTNNNIQVTIPVAKFDSGNSKRDSEVAVIIGGADFTPLRFEAKLPVDLKKNEIPPTIIGKLFIKGNENAVTLHLSQSSSLIRFKVVTKFSTLGVRVNSVGPGGLIAEPQDDLILYGQIPMSLIFEK